MESGGVACGGAAASAEVWFSYGTVIGGLQRGGC
ncbi:hypothetical protein A2U01_0096599 [Trifolium medium]|uniref:Uncharacterized protein n=1 Tax=Trifolium medium TaxID=97028 RepID=A0A392UP27_9FABA|nr:hypothetical protein [Trifolium medium]